MKNIQTVFLTLSLALVSAVSLAHVNPQLDQEFSTENLTETTYTVEVLAIHPGGHRAFTTSQHETLSAASMALQATLRALPDRATVVRAEILDGNGQVVVSL